MDTASLRDQESQLPRVLAGALIMEPDSAVLPPANCPPKLMGRWCSSTTQEEVQAQHTLKKCVILFVHFQNCM